MIVSLNSDPVAFTKFTALKPKPSPTAKPPVATLIVASIREGPSAFMIAKALGVTEAELQPGHERLVAAGVFDLVEGVVCCEWMDEEKGMVALLCDVLVAGGVLEYIKEGGRRKAKPSRKVAAPTGGSS
mgnify:CR=1 FL=1